MNEATPKRRVMVTGMGAITPLGLSLEHSWRACRAGEGAIAMHMLDASAFGPPAFQAPAALVPGDPLPALELALGKRLGAGLDRFAIYALTAALEAIEDAGLDAASLSGAGVVFGHGIGGVHTQEAGYERFFGKRSPRQHPLTVPKVMVSAAVSAIAIEFGVHGPVFAVASACASSGHAIAQGALLIQAGLADVVIVGGSEAIATPGGISAWEGLRAISPATCRPFSIGRDGMAIGEGGAALVLESLEHASNRGARVRAELAGVGMSSDATHWTQPDLTGALSAMRAACAQANILDEDEILISAHGTGTPLNDKNEARAINELFGERASNHAVIATKSAHGHLIGASSAAQSALAIRALEEGMAPPILNYLGPDSECALNLVLDQARLIGAQSVLVNSFAFGGLNASLVFRTEVCQA